METKEEKPLDLGSLGMFDFTPEWAKKDAGVSVGKVRSAAPAPRGKREGGWQGGQKDRAVGGNKGGGVRKPRFDRPREKFRSLDLGVKVLPDTRALGTIIRKLQSDQHAYKLKDLAYFFLDNPSSILLKIAPRDVQEDFPFYQCKVCGFASTEQNDVVEHILNAHIGEYYDAKEVACDPPAGNFNCVARCGLSGVLLGPPNIHEFNSIVKEMIRTRYPSMSESQYRAHIEMVRDAESIEKWRQGAAKKTVFVAKGDEALTELSREQVEGKFKVSVLPQLIEGRKQLMITAEVALKSPVKSIVLAVKDALEVERRAPYAMCFALRGAFHHRKLKLFRVNDGRGQEFVTSVELKEFDAEHAIPELAKIAKFIADNPCSAKVDIVKGPEDEQQLNWLVSTGHVVAFTNGVYSAVEKYPKYGPQWRKRSEKKSEDNLEKKNEDVKVEEENAGSAELAE